MRCEGWIITSKQKPRYFCKSCMCPVKPKDGMLSCCGHSYAEPAKDPDRCKFCGGKTRGFADDYFIKKCYCHELAENDEEGFQEW